MGMTRLAVDIGGTFTDVVLERDGALHGTKVPTTPEAPQRGFLDGVLRLLRETGTAPAAIGSIIHGTTLATNALVER
ncbi:MAG: hydantoinase/oxoprolinase family protein, partial [Proteobacteria bacterium]|nr:hydantoinase/oxoprolinase family protein [Pseudomonadota bacterium]